MPTELTALKLTELSLVDKPANPLAMAPIFKADTNGGDTMTDEQTKKVAAYMKEKGCTKEEAMKALKFGDTEKSDQTDELKTEIETFKTEIETLKADNERLRKGLIDAGFVIKADAIEKKAPVDYITVDGEQFNKADLPASVVKSLQEADAIKVEAEVKKRCDEVLPHVAKNNAKVLLKAHDSLEGEEAKSFEEFMRSLDALFDDLTEEVGKSAAQGEMTDPSEKLNALAKAYSAEHGTTFAKAYAEVVKTDDGKALTKAIYKKD